MKLPTRAALVAAAGALAAIGLTGCDAVSTVARSSTPVVLTGANLPALVGKAPSSIVAFRYSSLGGIPSWTQIPVQVDQRKVVDFGVQPSSNATAGVVGSVYGNGSSGVSALQYADPTTFVGADPDPSFDADDELAFMAADMGGKLAAGEASRPSGVVAGSGVAVQVDDPRAAGSAERGWVYLFASSGGLDPSAGQDYVNYQFVLTSGAYATTYKRAVGPNPETSSVVTPTYRAEFTDRWKEVTWKVLAPGSNQVDFLDANKNQFAINTCIRSNDTFATGEGAFVANIDGPVRAIRSYVGANSGPLTQRTHLMYRDREDVITDLRVHAIPAVMDFLDFSSGAVGMTYRSSTVPGGVTIDGTNDAVPTGLPTWEAVDGAPGTIYTHNVLSTSVAGLPVGQFYRDQTTPPETQCWGDGSLLGAAGPSVGGVPNTDPRSAPWATLQVKRIVQFGPPAADPAQIPAKAADWAADIDTPLTVAVSVLPS